jgi:hypothetical protein
MSTAEFASKIRYQLKKYHHTKLFWRSCFFRCPGQFEQVFQLFLTVAICACVSTVIAGLATRAVDPIETLLLLNAISSIACVFLISKLRYYYDATDFPRLNTIALLPWTDRQWLYEFLRGTLRSLIPPICFSLITLYSAARLSTLTGDYKTGLTIVAAMVQVLMVASLALYVTSYSLKLLQSPRWSLWLGRIKIIAFVAIAVLLYPPIAEQAISWRLSDAIFLLPPAWPTAIFRASIGDLSIIQTSISLFGCAVVAITIATLSIARLKKTFKVAEIAFGPLGDGYLLCQDAWEDYQFRRDAWATFEAEQSIVKTTIESSSAALDANALTVEPKTDDSFDEIMQPVEISYRNSLDSFWENQGWLGRWFDPDQRNIVAMENLTFDSNRSPWQFFRYYTGLLVIAAVYFLVAPNYLPSNLAYAVPAMLAFMAMGVFSNATTPLAASYRSLPLLASHWLWPPVKYQYLRLMMLMPPGAALITIVMLIQGFDSSVILKGISLAVVLAFVIPPTLRLATHGQETRDRISVSTIIGVVVLVIPIIVAGIGGLIGQFALDWPTNLVCVPITLIALVALWKLICYWQDKGSVDHYLAPKT